MKKLLIALMVMVVVALPTFAQPPLTSYAEKPVPVSPVSSTAWWKELRTYIRYEDGISRTLSPFLGTTIAEEGRILLAVLNKEGDTLKAGDCVVWDTTRILVCDTAATKKARLENNLSAEGGAHTLYVYAKTGTSADDSLWIFGLGASGSAQSEILPIADGDDQVLTPSGYWWTKIDSIKDYRASSGWTTYQVCAVPVCGVRASDGAEGDFAGIVSGDYDATDAWTSYILDNGTGYIVISGITDAKIYAPSYIWGGNQLYPAASGRLAALAAVTNVWAQDSISTLAQYVDTTFPIDSLKIKGSNVFSQPQHPVARAIELGTVTDGLIKVFVR